MMLARTSELLRMLHECPTRTEGKWPVVEVLSFLGAIDDTLATKTAAVVQK